MRPHPGTADAVVAAAGRNGGMCNNGFAQDYAAMAATLGTDTANRLYHSFDRAVDTVERLVHEPLGP